ncbi:MAG: S-layer homology domain-containing protein [Clostridia bacterium]|nr:S-layer homology domain-containing protein [Clostridia bacterium]
MNRLKKLFAILTTLALLVTILPLAPISADAATVKTDLVQLMLDLGIYETTDDMHYENELITREELASLLSVFYGLTEDSYPGETIFEDVVEGWSSGHIMTMVNYGLMSGYTDGLFRPKSNVTFEVAVKTLVSITGYDFLAQHKGGFPEGYFQVASDLDILKNIGSFNRTEPITRGEFTKLLYNTLNVPVLKQVTAGDRNEFKSETGETILTENLHIYQGKGMLNGLPYVELGYGKGAGKGKIKVGNTLYECDFDVYDFLGQQVTFYYHQDDDSLYGEVLHLESKSKEEECVTVDAKDILSFANRTFTYEEENKTKTISLPIDFMLIFNGKRLTNYTAAHLMPKQGNVRFCDTDSDGIYDKVIVTYEINYRVDSIEESSGELYVTDANGKTPLKLNADSSDYFYYVTDRGLAYNIHDLQKNDVISIAADQLNLTTGEVLQTSRVYHIQRASSYVSGRVTEWDGEILYVNDAAYTKSEELALMGKTVVTGNSYTFYLNYLGWIVDFEAGISDAKYGILTGIDTEGSLDTTTKLRIFTQDDEFSVFECSDKLWIDGVRKKDYNEINAYLKNSSTEFRNRAKMNVEDGMDLPNNIWQLVKYTVTEDGELNELDTIVENAVPSKNDLTHYKTKPVIATSWVNGNIGVINMGQEERYGLADDVIIFSIDTAPSEDEDYTIFSRASIGGTSEMMFFFDADDMNISKLMIRAEEGAGAKISGYETSNVMLFEGKKTIIGKEGTTCECIYGVKLLDGTKVSLEMEESFDLANVLPGDILRWKTDSKGKTISIQKALIRSDSTLGEYTKDSNEGWEGQFGGQLRLNYGRAEAISKDYLMIRFDMETGAFNLDDGGRFIDETVKTSSLGKIYVFDTAKNKVREGSVSDIRTARKYGASDADMLVSYFAGWSQKALVIYR